MQKLMLKKLVKILSLVLILVVCACGKQTKTQAPMEVVDSSIIVGELNWLEVTALSRKAKEWKNSEAVGEVKIPFFSVRGEARCTGFLISEDIVMTNEHCIPHFDLARGVTVSFKRLAGTHSNQWATYDCSEFIANNKTLDFALLRCKGFPGRKFGFIQLSSTPTLIGEPIYVIQQNCDYYLMDGCNTSKKISQGRILDLYQGDYVHNADTLGGSSGSPVFSARTHRLVALHHAGYGNNGLGRGQENYAVPTYLIYRYLAINLSELGITTSE